MRPTASGRRWLLGLLYVAVLLGVAAEDDEDDVFEDPDEPIAKPAKPVKKVVKKQRQEKASSSTGPASKKKRRFEDDDDDDIDKQVLKEQEVMAHEKYRQSQEMLAKNEKWGGVKNIDMKKYNKMIREVERKLTEVYEEGKPNVTSVLLLGHLARREENEETAKKLSDETLEKMLTKSATYYYKAASDYNSTEGLVLTGVVSKGLAEINKRMGKEKRKDEFLEKANEFFLSASARGNLMAVSELGDACMEHIGWKDGRCPFDVQQSVFEFYRRIADTTPGGMTYYKVAAAWAQGLGKDKVDMQQACEWNDRAVNASDKAIKDGGGKVKIKDLPQKGISVEAYVMKAACQYCGNYISTSTPDARVDARNTLKKMVHLKGLKKKEREKYLVEQSKMMMGPSEEPELVATLRWDRDVDGYGIRWFALIWVKKAVAFIYSQSRRETMQCKLAISMGEGEDDKPIFECTDKTPMRLTTLEMKVGGILQGASVVKASTGSIKGTFEIKPSIPPPEKEPLDLDARFDL